MERKGKGGSGAGYRPVDLCLDVCICTLLVLRRVVSKGRYLWGYTTTKVHMKHGRASRSVRR
jgi:hypothetical protein